MSTIEVQAQKNYCSNNPCKNGGTCISQDQAGILYRYSCICTPLWTGINCDMPSKGTGFISGGSGGISGGGWSSGSGSGSGSNSGGSSNNNQGGNSIGSGGSNSGGSGGSFMDNFSDKKTVKPKDPCYSNPCYNNGRCEAIDMFRYKCVDCPKGYDCQNRPSSNNQPSMKYKKNSRLGYILGTVLPVLVVVALICLCIYCCCCRKGDSSGFMSKFTQLPSQFGVTKSRQAYTQSANQMEDPDEAFKAHPPYQPPK